MPEDPLSGRRILVVEDDYFLAREMSRALRGTGANVLGPFPSEEAARDAIAAQRPSCAVIDINLGDGPCFALARTLQEEGIPFVFATGYDEAVIPADFAGATRLQKPIDLSRIVDVLAAALAGPGTEAAGA